MAKRANGFLLALSLVSGTAGALRAQSLIVSEGSEQLLLQRQPASRDARETTFTRTRDLPGLPGTPPAGATGGWDGTQVWVMDHSWKAAAWQVRRFRLSPKVGRSPAMWCSEPPVVLPRELTPILLLGHQSVFLRHRPAEAGKTEGTFEIGLFDLETRIQEVIHTGPEPPDFLQVAAVDWEGDALLVLNTGQVALLKAGDHQLRILEDDLWAETQPDVLLSATSPNGHTSPFPPRPLAPPFLGRDGRIGMLWQVRRKTHWTQEMMQAQFDALTPEWKEKVIRQGLWPPKASSYEGSDLGIAGIWVDPTTGHTEAIPEDRLRALCTPEHFTGLLQPKEGSFDRLREAEDGRILPIELPRPEALSGPSARPASPPDPRSPGAAAAPGPPHPAG